MRDGLSRARIALLPLLPHLHRRQIPLSRVRIKSQQERENFFMRITLAYSDEFVCVKELPSCS